MSEKKQLTKEEKETRAVSLFIATLLYKDKYKGFENLTKKADVIHKYICKEEILDHHYEIMDGPKV